MNASVIFLLIVQQWLMEGGFAIIVKENEGKDISISDYQMILEKLENEQLQNKQLIRVIQKLKEVAQKGKKQHYKNGKRGTKCNG